MSAGRLKRPASASAPPWLSRFSVAAGARFLAGSNDALRRRYNRTYQRSRVQPSRQDTRAGSRHKRYPCCGKRRNQCACDWAVIRQHLNRNELSAFKERLNRATLLRATDCEDTRFFLDLYAGQDVPLNTFFMMCLAYRRFNRPSTWQTLEENRWLGAGLSAPRWHTLRAALARLFAARTPVFGGVFYPATLRAFMRAGRWVSIGNMSQANRETLTLQLMWNAIPQDAVNQYANTPGPGTFAVLYDTFMANMAATTRGIFSEYSMKLVLDLLVCSGRVADWHLVRWPTGCPGYAPTMRRLFPQLPKQEWLRGLHWLFREIGPLHSLSMPEVMMHLCWDKRRADGALDDMRATNRKRRREA